MNALLVDLSKELIVLGLGATTTWVGTHVKRLARDLTAYFNMVRGVQEKNSEFEKRITELEKKLLSKAIEKL